MKLLLQYYCVIFISIFGLVQCQQKKPKESRLYLGADLSYVNEMLDCGGKYFENGSEVEPFKLFADKGTNLVRLRLWHNPDWTKYSNYEDVKSSIKKSKELGMSVLLDFHYSDNWADPGKQLIPVAWKNIESVEILGDSIYNYTFKVLMELHESALLPEMVQVGNETNSELMMPLESKHYDSINWERNIYLFNKGISAVNDVSSKLGKDIATMLHIAQPENAEWWFPKAFDNGIKDFDWIGLSYYPLWSKYKISEASNAIDTLKKLFNKRIMVVETAYPYVIEEFDKANNILWETAVLAGYPATPEGQKKYMIDLTKQVIAGGGEGVIYWEPAWISTKCATRWGVGSHWDNATFFDARNNNEVLPGMDFFNQSFYTE